MLITFFNKTSLRQTECLSNHFFSLSAQAFTVLINFCDLPKQSQPSLTYGSGGFPRRKALKSICF